MYRKLLMRYILFCIEIYLNLYAKNFQKLLLLIYNFKILWDQIGQDGNFDT